MKRTPGFLKFLGIACFGNAVSLMLICLTCEAFVWIGWDSGSGDGTYSDIIFYHDGEALDDANVAGGVATITYEAAVTAESGILGNSWRTNGENYSPILFASSNNVDYLSGICGFYYQPAAAWAATNYLLSDAQGSAGTYLAESSAVQLRSEFNNGGNTYQTFDGMASESLYYVTMKFDDAADIMTATVYSCTTPCSGTCTCNGTPITSYTSAQGAAVVGTNTVLGPTDSTAARDAFIDQLMCSNDPDRDLFAIRDMTSF